MSRSRQKAKTLASREQALSAALSLFSNQGFGATTMRQIAEKSGMSLGNLYHHFGNKEALFQQLLDDYWAGLQKPDNPLRLLYERANFPEDLEEMAEIIEKTIEDNAEYILLFYVDVIEFRGRHIRTFYKVMAREFRRVYGKKLEEKKQAGEIGDIDALSAVIMATRWLFYFYTVEKCFQMPKHFGMEPKKAVAEFIRLIRLGLLPRSAPPVQSGFEMQGESDF